LKHSDVTSKAKTTTYNNKTLTANPTFLTIIIAIYQRTAKTENQNGKMNILCCPETAT